MIRRSSSFKRRVQKRSEAERTASTPADIKGVRCKGVVRRWVGRKLTESFGVAYACPQGCVLAIHKSASDWTPFRAFPEETIPVPPHSVTSFTRPSTSGPDYQCLGISVNSQRVLELAFEESQQEEFDTWSRALRETAATPPTAMSAVPKAADASHARLEALRRELRRARDKVTAESEALRACRERQQQCEEDLDALVRSLPHEQEEPGQEGMSAVPASPMRSWGDSH